MELQRKLRLEMSISKNGISGKENHGEKAKVVWTCEEKGLC